MREFASRCRVVIPLIALAACGHFSPSTLPQSRPMEYRIAQTTIPPRHLLTLEYFGGPPRRQWSTIAPILDWAILPDASQSYAAHATGIRTLLYSNPNRQGLGDPMYTSDETTFAHDCSGNRITFLRHPSKFLMDAHSTALAKLWQQTVINAFGQFDATFEDGAVTVAGVTSALPCNFTQSDWAAATNTMDASLGRPILENSDLGSSGGRATVALGLALNPTTIGGMQEQCYANSIPLKPRGDTWLALENSEIQFGFDGKLFACRSDSGTQASDAQDARTYMLASFLLTYDPSTSIISEHWKTPSKVEVEPESRLVALDPLVAQPFDVSGLEQSIDVFGREYGSCYVDGSSIGPCAVAINIDAPVQPHAFPWPGKYGHTLVLTGGAIEDGGTMAIDGPPPPAQIPGDDAVVSFQ